jgi:integrase
VKIDLPNLIAEPDRHGNERYYVRRKVADPLAPSGYRQRRIRVRGEPGSDAFMAAYRTALDALKVAPSQTRPRIVQRAHGSLGWLAAEYFGSTEFKALNPRSQRTRRGVIEGCLREPVTPESHKLMRDCPLVRVDATHIMMFRDRKVNAGLSGAANNRRKYLGSMFSWAIEAKKYGITVNPCRDAKKARVVTDGFYTWTINDVLAYVRRHQPGTMAYLALALMLFLGARRQDAARLGPKNDRGDVMVYVPRKTTYRRVEESVKPILPALRRALKITPHGLQTFLVTEYGKPFTDAGLGNKMRAWCDAAGLPECTAHGLKKIAATLCAENGATDRQMMDLFDWTSESMATPYTRKANKLKLAAGAAAALGISFSWEQIETLAGSHRD